MRNGWINQFGTVRHYVNDKLHNDNGPAVIFSNGSKEWYKNGLAHREDGPACEYVNGKHWYLHGSYYTEDAWKLAIVKLKEISKTTDAKSASDGWLTNSHGDKIHYVNNEIHHDSEPARVNANGTKAWYKHGKYHREDGPAIEYYDGAKYWYKEGKRHRLDGPAIIGANPDSVSYYIDGRFLFKQEWEKAVAKLNNCNKPKNGWVTDQFGDKYHYVNDVNYNPSGPSIIWSDGSTSFHNEKGQLHNENGYAYINTAKISVPNEFWLNNKHYVKEHNYKKALAKIVNDKKNLDSISDTIMAATIIDYGTTYKYVNGKLHCDDGPASIYKNGTKFWYKHGKRHREDGPALEGLDGHIEFWRNNQRHNIDGPAIIYADGTKCWYINGLSYTESEYLASDFIKRLKTDQEPKASTEIKQSVSAIDTLKTDASQAGWRVVAKQIPKAARTALLNYLTSKGAKKSWIKAASEMLETESGRASISLMLGWGLTHIPYMKDDPTAIKLAEEWRVDAMATFGDSLFNELFSQIAPIMMSLKTIPQLRIAAADISKLEDDCQDDEESLVYKATA